MSRVRPPAAAGVFYPADPTALLSEVRRLLDSVPVSAGTSPPKALIVPHAGLRYSGPVAASAYARIAPQRGEIRTVVLVGPAHYASGPGIFLSSAAAFASPLGRAAIDREATGRILGLPCVRVADGVHAPEHALEVQLPFIQAMLGDAAIVPVLAGERSGDAVATVLEALWGGPETLLVITSDLSHYLAYDAARALDRATADAVEALAPEAIPPRGACGRSAVEGLLRVARGHALTVRTLDLRSSGDTGGGRERVVGYGAFALEPAPRGGAPTGEQDA
jgi:AmmeMemoRadiSam system protein B